MSNPSDHSNGTDRSNRSRRHFSAQEKVAILRLHLLEGVPVPDVSCFNPLTQNARNFDCR